MISASCTLADWAEALHAAARELLTHYLGLAPLEIVEGAPPSLPPAETGPSSAHLLLTGENGDTVQVGLVSDRLGCQILACRLLGEDDVELSASDTADALNEIVNIIAGDVKQRLEGRIPPARIGLPIFNTECRPQDTTGETFLTVRTPELSLLLLSLRHT